MKKIIAIFLILIICVLGLFVFRYKYNDNSKTEENVDVVTDVAKENSEENVNNSNNSDLKNNNKNDEQINNQNNTTANNKADKEIKTELSPRGFMGSSLYKVTLYTDGEVYVKTFDGNGYNKENIVSDELIAKKATSIKSAENEEDYGMIIIKAGEIINKKFGWIDFE